jgi:hypothetical protein
VQLIGFAFALLEFLASVFFVAGNNDQLFFALITLRFLLFLLFCNTLKPNPGSQESLCLVLSLLLTLRQIFFFHVTAAEVPCSSSGSTCGQHSISTY